MEDDLIRLNEKEDLLLKDPVKALATILFINYGEGFESSPISPHYSTESLYQNHLAKKMPTPNIHNT